MENKFSKYFLAANSAEGFVSHFADSYNAIDGWRAFIIKGGPGTGKSSFMKYVAIKAADMGYEIELCPCSSDPDSLDGVIIKELKIVLLDGTSPHVVEPKYVGVCEQIINLGEFWAAEKLRKNSSEIINVTIQNKKLHKTASAYISAAGELAYDCYKLSERFTNTQKVEQFAQKTALQLIKNKSNNMPKETVRFLGGVTPKGVVAFKRTVEDFYDNIVVIDDKYGAVANVIMEKVRKIALARGYEIITLKNPVLPSKIIDHVLIPELSLAFVREYDYIKFGEQHRRIHARRFYDINVLRPCRSRLTFNRRMTRELLLGAIDTLEKAKKVHDDLEKYYISAMDFDKMTLFAQAKANEILNKKP